MITHGLDGFMVGHLTAGMSPVHHMIHAVPQVSTYHGDSVVIFFCSGAIDGCVPLDLVILP